MTKRDRFPMAETKKMAVGGLLLAVGILLPQVFHLAGGSAMGTLFLPMHLPVLLGGFLLGPLFGGTVGLLTPLVSCLLTGMPAAAVLPTMAVELLVYGLAGGAFYKQCRLPALVSLVLAQAAGRLVKALLLLVMAGVFGLKAPPALSVFTAALEGLPGLAVQWAVIPLLLTALRKSHLLESPAKRKREAAMSDWELARSRWEAENATCAVCRNGQVRVSHLTGIRPLLVWLGEDGDALRDGAAADKIVGRAAALLFLYGGVRAVYAAVISEGALALLEENGVQVAYGRCVPYIINRENTGLCPMEQRVRDIRDPADAYEALAAQAGGQTAP